jgi:DNA repair protein RecN (Recombination protein N)
MLTLLKIRNVALIDDLTIEFGGGLNVLTGETGSGKSIIVDSLAALTGERVSNDIIKQGEDTARIEGLFRVDGKSVGPILDGAGLEAEGDELIIRREISLAGRNRIFVNNQLVTQGFLKQLGPRLAEIHGQGEQAALYNVSSHIAILDAYAGLDKEKTPVAAAYDEWHAVRAELAALESDESEKLQLVDILKFQVDEISRASLQPDEDAQLDDEKRRLNNVEKLSALSGEAHSLLYDDEHSTLATLDRAAKLVTELAEYDPRFRGFDDGLNSARAVAEELGRMARDFGASLEFSPERLDEIEERLADIARLKRKYGETIELVLEHLRVSEERLNSIETAELREQELRKQLDAAATKYRDAADKLHHKRVAAAAKFSTQVEQDLKAVALERAKFGVTIDIVDAFSPNGIDRVQFVFSANPGEPARPLAKVASGGEASRLMLILKTASRSNDNGKTAVFDEIDIGIGGRVAEAVGRKLKSLAATQQVFCVTHQPQIASLADKHFVVEKETLRGRTTIGVRELDESAKVEELARMLAGHDITEQARENARAMLAAAG